MSSGPKITRIVQSLILLRSCHVHCFISSLAQGARRGRPIAAAPCPPGLWRTKSPLRGTLGLSLAATGSGA
ncbi:hypothetical protein EA432_20145, partial [Escherichia coli]